MNPLVSGIPAKERRNPAKAVATHGERFPKPFQRLRSVTSPAESRTKVTIAKAPTVVMP